MEFIILVFAVYFLTSLYFEAMNIYNPIFYQNLKSHPIYKYWTFCYQCTSFWLTLPLILLSVFTMGKLFVGALAVAGLAYIIYNLFETLVSYNLEG